jgi:hypothetical protein
MSGKASTILIQGDTMLWHYTIWLDEILDDGVLKPSTQYLADARQWAVWFSKNPQWEATVKKTHPLTGRDMTFTELSEVGLARIGVAVETAPVGWQEYQRLTGMTRPEARMLEKAGRAWGANPKDWFVSFDPVPQDRWLAVEVWRNHRWCPHVYAPAAHPGKGRRGERSGLDANLAKTLALLERLKKSTTPLGSGLLDAPVLSGLEEYQNDIPAAAVLGVDSQFFSGTEG